MVDRFGVRSTALFSTTCSLLSSAVFVFGRSKASLMVAVMVLSPAGDGSFDPCFRVGITKCTTEVSLRDSPCFFSLKQHE